MKRFVTYLYEYENGQKTKTKGFLRVDIRKQLVSIQVSIRCPELENEIGKLYIVVRDKDAYSICLGEVKMKEGQYQGAFDCGYPAIGQGPYTFMDAIGAAIQFAGGRYLASSWKDDADEVIARRDFSEYGVDTEEKTSQVPEVAVEEIHDYNEHIEVAALVEENRPEESFNFIYEENYNQDTYRKINLNEIATLPSSNWHFSHNSFLIHGFWNYGYLVLKEEVEEGQKKLSLGVPGIYEQPEMVMATYFGFPTFTALPPEVAEMVVGELHQAEKKENQEPKVGTFGCWFVDL